MRTDFFRSRLLGLIGSTSFAASIVAPTACGGSSIETNTAGQSGEGGQSGSGGGATDGGYGSWSGGFCDSERVCMSATLAWRKSTNWEPDDWSTGGPAGSGGESGSSGGAEAAGYGGDDQVAPTTCPLADNMPSGLCYWYEGGDYQAGRCCYEFHEGDCCGRPFVVNEISRLAGLELRGDWLDHERSPPLELAPETRRALAEAWLFDALLEHASIASFSRFVLELLSVSAPATLIEQAGRALSDEIAHAHLCFSLANRYAQQPMGASALDITGSITASTLAEIAARAVIEGCVGETLAALQAEAQLAVACDSRVRTTLARIADDEMTHAELAWAFVRWAVERGGDDVRIAVANAFRLSEQRLLTERVEPTRANVDRASLHAHGRLTEEERLSCHLRAFHEVIAPCRDALLEGEFLRDGETATAAA
jgi:hypothetical protein